MAVSTIDPNGLNIGQIGGTRNLIINGAMQVDQRGTNGSPVTVNSGIVYATDRFCGNIYGSGTGVFTLEQDTVTTLDEFRYITRATVTTADASPASGYGYGLRQVIEGYLTAPLKWGFSGAQTVTLSFWVRSSVTGLYSATVMDSNAYNNTQGYTINSANTWEYKTVTFSGPTSYATDITNGFGAYVVWGLGGGSSRTVADSGDTWNGNSGLTPTKVTGGVDWIATLGATFDITGVQLEVGDTATPFEHRSYGQELALCQRYFYTTFTTKAPVNGTVLDPADDYYSAAWRHSSGSGIVGSMCSFPVQMRATPTMTYYNSTSTSSTSGVWGVYDGTSWSAGTSMGELRVNLNQITPSLSVSFSSDFNHNYLINGGFSADAEL